MEDVVFNPPINETEICDSIAKCCLLSTNYKNPAKYVKYTEKR